MARKTAVQILCYGVGVLAFAGIVSLTVIQRQTISQLREQSKSFEAQQTELERLRAENQQSQQLRNQETELQRLREETKDLLRLRNEVRQFREQLQELETLRAANAQLLQAAQSTAGITSNQAAVVLEARKRGSILGVHIRPSNDTQGGTAGAMVIGIDTNSPVAQSGLQTGDIIVSLDGRPIQTAGQLQTEMLTRKPGEVVVLDVVRGRTVMRFQVKTRAWPE